MYCRNPEIKRANHLDRDAGAKYRTVILTAGLLSVAGLTGAAEWVDEGPGPIGNAQVEGSTVNGEVVGAIHALAPHPTDASILYVGSVNGGVWKTSNAGSTAPTWTNLTDNQNSLSISALAFDPTDVTHMTLMAGSGRFSSFASEGGDRIGLLRTTDGGSNWTAIDGGTLGLNISDLAPRGNTILVSSTNDAGNTCNIGIHRSTDGGASFTVGMNGIPLGAVTAMVGDPANPAILYADINTFGGGCGAPGDGLYKTSDTGASWTKVSDATMDALGAGHYEIAVGPSNTVFASITTASQLAGVFRSTDGGGNWTAMDLPGTIELRLDMMTTDFIGIHPGSQGDLHNSIAADPNNNAIVYVGGDRQPRTDNDSDNGSFPNSIGARNFTGRLFRGDASQTAGMQPSIQWTSLTHSGTMSNSAPHADSRDMAFDAAGTLLEADDGGVYKRTSPQLVSGDWFSLNGNIRTTEMHDSSFDTLSQIVQSGNQDTGAAEQTATGVLRWNEILQGDGGDTETDNQSSMTTSIRYTSSQNLGGFSRTTYNAMGVATLFEQPALTLVGGNPITKNFVTPVQVNQVNGARLIIAGRDNLYQSADRGDTISELANGLTAVSVGGTIGFGSTDNENALYVAASDGVYVATAANTAPTIKYTATNQMRGVALDRSDSTHAFAIEPDRIVRTSDAGANFVDVTGNLASFSFGELRSVVYMENATDDAVAVGSNRGVFVARASGGFSAWSRVGTLLPNAPVFELDYDPATDKLVAGTFGRGAFSIPGILSGNTPPTPQDDSIMLNQGGTSTVLTSGQTSLLANDTDPEMQNLTIETTPVVAPSNGLVTINANGTFSYSHNGSATTTDNFAYKVCDDGQPSMCANAMVNVTVMPDGGALTCSTPGSAIPDGIGNLTDTINVTTMGALTDLNVRLDITHTYVGDLTVNLTHVNSGTMAVLLMSPGGGNCDQANVGVTFDDSAPTTADSQCATMGEAISGTRSPTGMLSSFNGLEFSGAWTLTISDPIAPDTGTLDNWCLIQTIAPNDIIFANGFEN